MTLIEKIAYIKGLTEGIRLDESKDEVRVIKSIIDVLQEMAEELDGCSAVILESNYDEYMLKHGTYPDELKRRILSEKGHLSNAQCAEILPYLYKNGTRRVLLAHISPENNTPELALESALSSVKRYGLDGMSAEPAKRFEITKLI